MKIAHHPDEATLMSYAAGSLPEALSAVVAAHIDVCPACTKELRLLESVGAALFERIDGAQLAAAGQKPASAPAPVLSDGTAARPVDHEPVLTSLLGRELSEIHWKRLGFGIWHYPIKLSPDAKGDLRLINVAPGQVLPEHGHGGSELTLILQGSYQDEFGCYRAGDMSDLGDDVDHRPVSDPVEGCICLIASEKKARFKDVVARLVQPLTGL